MFSWERARTPKKPAGVTVNIEGTGYASVERAIKSLGYALVWDRVSPLLFWCDTNVGVDFCLHMKPWQFVNHFPGTFAVARKVELAKTLERMRQQFPLEYDYHPRTFYLPSQAADAKRCCAGGKRTLIVKPDLGAQGRGIFLAQDAAAVDECRDSAVAQEYISPCLIDGLKFDLRVYVLVTSVEPNLRMYVYKEGMARFCTEKYEKPEPGNLDQVYRHLTNYSVNKKNENFKQQGESASAHKRPMSEVLRDLKAVGGDPGSILHEIHRILALTVIAALPMLRHNYRASFKALDGKSRCFEILGFDVLIDENLKPWVLEVNHSPSLSCDSGFDRDLKDSLIADALRIVDIPEDFMEQMKRMEKAGTLQRIGCGTPNAKRRTTVFNVDREVKIAKTTGWLQLYPAPENPLLEDTLSEVVEAVNGIQLGKLEENTATSLRRKSIQQHMKEMQERAAPPKKRPGKVIVTKLTPVATPRGDRTTKSVLLLREARLAKIREVASKECMFMISPEYENYLKEERNGTARVRRRPTQ